MIAVAAVLVAALEIASLDDIAAKGAVISVEEGTCAERQARLSFPSNRFVECFDVCDGIVSLEGGKVDALIYDRPYLDFAALNRDKVRVLDENIGMSCISVGAFRKFVFPQAVRIVLPVYRGMLISMFKETSVVGYVTVCDLTRVGDFIRARTYDGFFPLALTAVIYFVLAKLMAYALKAVGDSLGPRRKEKTCR